MKKRLIYLLCFSILCIPTKVSAIETLNELPTNLQQNLSTEGLFHQINRSYYGNETLKELNPKEKVNYLLHSEPQKKKDKKIEKEIIEEKEEVRVVIPEDSIDSDYEMEKRYSNEYLLEIENPDLNYQGESWEVNNRDLLEAIVYGEYGMDYTGSVLVAQTIRDTMVRENTHDIGYIINKYGYSGATNKGTNEIAKRAVSYIFDEGKSGVQHRLMCFYASNICNSSWHEAQNFVVQHQYVRFFDF